MEFSRQDAKTLGVDENDIGRRVVWACIAVHRELGPGLLESVYVKSLAWELEQRQLFVQQQVPISIRYGRMVFDDAFRADIVVERKVILELKSVEVLTTAHRKQLQTYLRLSGCRLGFLLNFGAAVMKDGITRAVNGLPEDKSGRATRRHGTVRPSAKRDGG